MLDFSGAIKRIFSALLFMIIGIVAVNFLGPLILHAVGACGIQNADHSSPCADLWRVHYEKYFVGAVIFGLLFRMNRAVAIEQRQKLRQWKAERKRRAEKRSWKS
jgi:hypothetical protein